MLVKDKKIFVTKEGLEKLKKEYDHLLTEKRKEVATRIQKARELGDITENAEYDSALDEQAMVEGRIDEVAEMLKRAAIIDDKNEGSRGGPKVVKVGSIVRVHLDGQETEFQIVGEVEVDPLLNRISHESPFGSSLLGKKVGDEVHFEAPAGRLAYTIVSVK